jgi:hypothetical protein
MVIGFSRRITVARLTSLSASGRPILEQVELDRLQYLLRGGVFHDDDVTLGRLRVTWQATPLAQHFGINLGERLGVAQTSCDLNHSFALVESIGLHKMPDFRGIFGAKAR